MSPQRNSKASTELNELSLILLWQDVLMDLAIQESKAGRLARSILRAEREGRGKRPRLLGVALYRSNHESARRKVRPAMNQAYVVQ